MSDSPTRQTVVKALIQANERLRATQRGSAAQEQAFLAQIDAEVEAQQFLDDDADTRTPSRQPLDASPVPDPASPGVTCPDHDRAASYLCKVLKIVNAGMAGDLTTLVAYTEFLADEVESDGSVSSANRLRTSVRIGPGVKIRPMASPTLPGLIPPPDWLLGDTHVLHENILDYEPGRRAWADTIEAHDAAIRKAWNVRVNFDETVLHLGDVAWGTKDAVARWRFGMFGKIVLLRGNHDRGLQSLKASGFEAYNVVTFEDPVMGLVCCRHDPAHFTDNEILRADVLLHGHLHGKPLEVGLETMHRKAICLSLDVLPSPPAPVRLAHLRKRWKDGTW